MNTLRRPSRSNSGRKGRKLLGQLIWPGMLKGERGTTTYRMTRGASDDEPRDDTPPRRHHPKINPGAQQTETNSKIGQDQSERKLVGSSTKENRSTEH
jgi:hypothetical protein